MAYLLEDFDVTKDPKNKITVAALAILGMPASMGYANLSPNQKIKKLEALVAEMEARKLNNN